MLRTGEVIPQHEAIYYDWTHDVTGHVFNEHSVIVLEALPQFANHWFDSIYGGNTIEFKDDEGNQHEVTTEEGVKGIVLHWCNCI
jgi:hypothetical protein